MCTLEDAELSGRIIFQYASLRNILKKIISLSLNVKKTDVTLVLAMKREMLATRCEPNIKKGRMKRLR